MGNVLTKNFAIRSSFFPFSKEFVTTDLYGNGTYAEKTHIFKPSQYGQMGWKYNNGVDLSDYKYLVIKLKRANTCSAHLNIYTTNSIWGDCCASPEFGGKKQIVINLQEARYTSENRVGELLDLTNIRIICFWGNGNGSIVVDTIYLTNNDDYSPYDPDAIESLTPDLSPVDDDSWYDLSGRKIADGKWPNGKLPSGIYINGGKKYQVK